MTHLGIKLAFWHVSPKEPHGRDRGWGATEEVSPAPGPRAGPAPRGRNCLPPGSAHFGPAARERIKGMNAFNVFAHLFTTFGPGTPRRASARPVFVHFPAARARGDRKSPKSRAI